MKKLRQKMWAIKNEEISIDEKAIGFYCGTYLTRSEAIEEYCSVYEDEDESEEEHKSRARKSWQYCRRNGDRCVKVEVREL